MGAKVGVFGLGEVFNQFAHLGVAEGVSGFDRHFAGAHDVDVVAGGGPAGGASALGDLVDHVLEDSEGGTSAPKGGHGADKKGIGSKRLKIEAHSSEFCEVIEEEGEKTSPDGKGGGIEERLTFDGGLTSGVKEHLVQDALVGDVLIDEEEASGVLGDDEGLVDLTKDAEVFEEVGGGDGELFRGGLD